MSRPARFAAASAVAAALGVGGLAFLLGAPWQQIAAFMVFAALLGAVCVVLLAHALSHPRAEPSSDGDDTIVMATIAADTASSACDVSGHSAGGRGL